MLSEENEPKETMVLILDRYSEIGAHKDLRPNYSYYVWIDLSYLMW